MQEDMKDEQIEVISKLLKSMSHPIRLKILCLLQDHEMSVGDIRSQVKTTNANVSQHLNILRSQGIIDVRKDANFIFI
jgi:ArsR family transcriptional regulator